MFWLEKFTMSEENPLVNLKDIHLPPPVSFGRLHQAGGF
ncbi:MAG: hypothetical protein CM1200mP30_16740 [Pseudomonadota bacterium]|nr:MAG: hypothetical protein CM1200mP30_16740 [Pseudomonadota bacterium]